MKSREKLVESTISKLLESKTYYEIMATNRGMWGGLQSPMSTNGKYIVFTNKEAAREYLDYINNNSSKVNNFNSYSIQEIEEDEVNDYCLVVNTVEELKQKQKELKDQEVNQRQENINTILDLKKLAEEIISENKELYQKASVETKNTDSEYGNVELTIYVRSKKYHEAQYKLNDLYINIEIKNETGEIKLYCENKTWYDKEEIEEVKETIKELFNSFNEAQK